MSGPATARQPDLLDKIVIGLGVVGAAMFALMFWAYKVAYDAPRWDILSAAVIGVFFLAFWYVAFVRSTLTTKLYTYFLGIWLVMIVAFSGLNEGVKDRTSSYSAVKDENAWCSKFIVLRPVSSNLLAIGADESRVVIDQDCRVRYTLVSGDRHRPVAKATGYEAIRDALIGSP
jgi:hypothetical protein